MYNRAFEIVFVHKIMLLFLILLLVFEHLNVRNDKKKMRLNIFKRDFYKRINKMKTVEIVTFQHIPLQQQKMTSFDQIQTMSNKWNCIHIQLRCDDQQ